MRMIITHFLASEAVCVPRSQFKNKCNTCTCSDDGLSAACTRMICINELWNEDGSLENIVNRNKIAESGNV